jgi:hypothetical protein
MELDPVAPRANDCPLLVQMFIELALVYSVGTNAYRIHRQFYA